MYCLYAGSCAFWPSRRPSGPPPVTLTLAPNELLFPTAGSSGRPWRTPETSGVVRGLRPLPARRKEGRQGPRESVHGRLYAHIGGFPPFRVRQAFGPRPGPDIWTGRAGPYGGGHVGHAVRTRTGRPGRGAWGHPAYEGFFIQFVHHHSTFLPQPPPFQSPFGHPWSLIRSLRFHLSSKHIWYPFYRSVPAGCGLAGSLRLVLFVFLSDRDQIVPTWFRLVSTLGHVVPFFGTPLGFRSLPCMIRRRFFPVSVRMPITRIPSIRIPVYLGIRVYPEYPFQRRMPPPAVSIPRR